MIWYEKGCFKFQTFKFWMQGICSFEQRRERERKTYTSSSGSNCVSCGKTGAALPDLPFAGFIQARSLVGLSILQAWLDTRWTPVGSKLHSDPRYSVPNNMMAAGSLCIGSTDTDYGYQTGWTSNTAGIMMECNDITEIVVHDSGTRLASLLYYYG